MACPNATLSDFDATATASARRRLLTLPRSSRSRRLPARLDSIAETASERAAARPDGRLPGARGAGLRRGRRALRRLARRPHARGPGRIRAGRHPARGDARGTVVETGDDGGRGNYIAIWSAEARRTFVYLHMLRPTRSSRATGAEGQRVGAVGCTGSCWGDHLHLEMRRGRGTTGRPHRPAARADALQAARRCGVAASRARRVACRGRGPDGVAQPPRDGHPDVAGGDRRAAAADAARRPGRAARGVRAEARGHALRQATPQTARDVADKTWDLVHDRADDDPVKRRVVECHEALARLSARGGGARLLSFERR